MRTGLLCHFWVWCVVGNCRWVFRFRRCWDVIRRALVCEQRFPCLIVHDIHEVRGPLLPDRPLHRCGSAHVGPRVGHDFVSIFSLFPRASRLLVDMKQSFERVVGMYALQKVRDCDGVQKALLVVLQTIGTRYITFVIGSSSSRWVVMRVLVWSVDVVREMWVAFIQLRHAHMFTCEAFRQEACRV